MAAEWVGCYILLQSVTAPRIAPPGARRLLQTVTFCCIRYTNCYGTRVSTGFGEAALSHRRGCRFFDRRVDQVLEVFEAGAAADGVAVDEKERGAVYAQAVAFLAILVNLWFEAMSVQVFGESRDVEVQLRGLGDEVFARERD